MTLLPANGPDRLRYTAPGLYLPQPAGDPVVHWTTRPTWLCLVDETSWPCPAARGELRQVFPAGPGQLARFLGELLGLAARDLPDCTPAELHARFVAWTLPNPGPFPTSTRHDPRHNQR